MALRSCFANGWTFVRLALILIFQGTQAGIEMTLTWEASYAIALELSRQHPEINIEEVSLQQIYDWTIKLSEFEDDPLLANDDILYAIYQEWYEEYIDGK